jgi:apolipoprotein N-acyltransferase
MKYLITLLLSGALTTLAFAPFFAVPVLLVTIPLLLASVRNAASPRRAFWLGWWFGLGYSCASIYWFAYALLVDAARFGWLVPFAVGGIGSALAVYSALTALAAHRFRHLPIHAYCLAFALLWTIAEILRSLLFSGFPWNLLGYSWAATDISIQAGSIGGVWWLSLLTVIFASTPLWIHARATRATALAVIAFAGLLTYGYLRLDANPTAYVPDVKLRLVQPNIPQTLKWDKSAEANNIQRHITMSLSKGYEDITHLIWAESAMTFRLEEGGFWTQELGRIAPAKGALITGTVRVQPSTAPNTPPALFNSLNVITPDGEIASVYDKRKLVPFGEYIPFRSILPLDKITQGGIDFSTGTSAEPLHVRGAPDMRPQICYEAIFPWLSDGAHPHWILNITNDAWFGISTAPYQHFQMTRMRGVEQGVALIRSAGGGISGAVDAYGRVLATLPLNTEGVLDTPLPQPAAFPTLYSQYGNGIVGLTMVLIIVYLRWSQKCCRTQLGID